MMENRAYLILAICFATGEHHVLATDGETIIYDLDNLQSGMYTDHETNPLSYQGVIPFDPLIWDNAPARNRHFNDKAPGAWHE